MLDKNWHIFCTVVYAEKGFLTTLEAANTINDVRLHELYSVQSWGGVCVCVCVCLGGVLVLTVSPHEEGRG